jgi:alkylation response protein AidB-like acyl-CoA dehydrogenase
MIDDFSPFFREEHRSFRSVLRDFATRELLPGAAERDRTGTYPADLVRRLAELDLMGITVPVEDGGLGLDTLMLLVAVEEIAYGDAALASIYTAHYLGLDGLVLFGTPDQRRRYLPDLASGRALAGFALTEPEAGSDIGAIRTIARRDGDGWRISGTKIFISNAREASLLTLFAKTDPEAGFRGISAFLLPTDRPGISFSPPQDKSGIRAAPTYQVCLDDVLLPADALLGQPGEGGKIALTVLNRARIDIAAMANGIAMRALQLASQYAATRRQFGRPIRDFESIQLLLAEMEVLLEVGRLAAYRAAQLKDAGADVRRAAAIAKYVATENAFACVDRALQIHGGYGYMRESEIERLYRDCRVLRIYEGTSQIQLLTLARLLVRRQDETGSVV